MLSNVNFVPIQWRPIINNLLLSFWFTVIHDLDVTYRSELVALWLPFLSWCVIVLGLAWLPPRGEKVNSSVSEATTIIAGILIVPSPHSTQIPLRYIKMGHIRGCMKRQRVWLAFWRLLFESLPDWRFHNFTKFLRANARIMPFVSTSLLLTTSHK
jgi:hypothetical protein